MSSWDEGETCYYYCACELFALEFSDRIESLPRLHTAENAGPRASKQMELPEPSSRFFPHDAKQAE
jgi:hypothetical protein